jgi:hypothetical protein
MQLRTSKALALLGGVATLALGTTFMLRLSAPKTRAFTAPCAPRLVELEQAMCEAREPLATQQAREQLAELALHAPN